MPPLKRLPFALSTLLLLLSTLCSTALAAPKWEPIAPSDLKATHCVAYPDAKAEVLFVHEEIEADTRVVYQRIKLYDESYLRDGVGLRIDYGEEDYVWDVAVRVVKPDGSETHYTRKDFRESTALRTREGIINRLTAAFSGLSSGDIIEMRWKRSLTVDVGDIIWNWCQQEIPVREYSTIVYSAPEDYTIEHFNLANVSMEKVDGSARRFVARDIPPYLPEPLSPPAMDVRGWYGIFLISTYWRGDKPLEVWNQVSDFRFEFYDDFIKPDSNIRKVASEVLQGETRREAMLPLLYNWCRTNVSNLDYFKNAALQKVQKKRNRVDEWTPADTLKRRAGTSGDINLLFASLARAAGFDVRIATTASRKRTLNVSFVRGYQFLTEKMAAVKVGGDWRLFTPGDYFVTPGMLHWSVETVPFLRCEPTTAVMDSTPATPFSRTAITRKGRFKLDLEGTLEGDIEINHTGHAATQLNEQMLGAPQEQIDMELSARVTKRLPTAEVSGIQWTERLTTKPSVSVRYHVKVPGYAEQLGERLAFPPGFFTRGESPLFTAPSRKYGIFFDYPLTQMDDIEIALPDNYVPDSSSMPPDVTPASSLLTASYSLGFKPVSHVLVYKRNYIQCGDNTTTYQATAYPIIKRLTELIAISDAHMFLCKPAQPAIASTAGTASR